MSKVIGISWKVMFMPKKAKKSKKTAKKPVKASKPKAKKPNVCEFC